VRVEGERTPLRPSLGHPFWVKRGDAVDGVWMEAGTMRVGDLLQTMQGDWRRVVSITPVDGQETVYNFTVDKDHDYFVGETGFLVHNAGIDCDCGSRRAAFRTAKRLLGVAMSTVPQVFGPGSREFGMNPTQNGRLYLFGPPEPGTPAIREDFPAEYPSGPPQGPHFNYGEFNPDDPKSLDGHCNF